MAEKTQDSLMGKLNLHDLGLKMGCDPETARQSAFQFMKIGDPRINMLRRFATAMGITLEELIAENKRGRSK